MYAATIDTGTSTTRVIIFKNSEIMAFTRVPVGVRDTVLSGSPQKLIAGVAQAVTDAVNIAGIDKSSLDIIVASGMITSNLGLHEIPHCCTPADIYTLAHGMESKLIAEIAQQPIWFIPGVKNKICEIQNNSATYSSEMDFMRGEEIEVFGLLDNISDGKDYIIILPGSHCKILSVEFNAEFHRYQIMSSLTTLSGELLHTLTNNTILADSLGRAYADDIDSEMLLEGFKCAKKYGASKAYFTVRVLEREYRLSRNRLANFLLGAVIYSDISAVKSILNTEHNVIVASSRENIAYAYAAVGKYDGLSIEKSDAEYMRYASGYGAILAAKARGLL